MRTLFELMPVRKKWFILRANVLANWKIGTCLRMGSVLKFVVQLMQLAKPLIVVQMTRQVVIVTWRWGINNSELVSMSSEM